MYISPIGNRGVTTSSQQTFRGKHLPRTFQSMMNYLYKNLPNDLFRNSEMMRVSTLLEDGRELYATAHFYNGKFIGLIMDEGSEALKQTFMRTALKRYNKNVASPKIQQKLGYDK